jgi:hypothetical protein
MRASVEAGGKSLSQNSQFGLNSNAIPLPSLPHSLLNHNTMKPTENMDADFTQLA